MKKIILASGSPRRKEILKNLDIDFSVLKSNIEEEIYNYIDPIDMVLSLAYLKADDIVNQVKKGIIISADTIVVIDGEILGKPKDKLDAFNMLKKLNGRKHKVITGVCLIDVEDNSRVVDYEETIVEFRKIDDSIINSYIDTGEPMDKAGSYGIQGYGALLVKEINGCYQNVVGLPISKLGLLLKENFNYSIL